MLKIINRIDDKFPFRVYELSNGDFLPSVTSVMSLVHEQDIAKWRKNVGNVVADRVSLQASTHGTKFHELMESCMNSIKEGKELPKIKMFGEFFQVYNTHLKKHIFPSITNVKLIEHQMFSTSLKCAGTVDLLADWKGETAIIDWKTTRRHKKLEDVTNYFGQLACYAYIAREKYGIIVKKLVLVFNENDETVYTMEQTNIQHWLEFFVQYRKVFFKRYGI